MVSGDWIVLSEHPGRSGAQMVWNVQDGTNNQPDRMNRCGITPGDKVSVLRGAVQLAVDLGMPHVEIYSIDCLDPLLSPVLTFAAATLH